MQQTGFIAAGCNWSTRSRSWSATAGPGLPVWGTVFLNPIPTEEPSVTIAVSIHHGPSLLRRWLRLGALVALAWAALAGPASAEADRRGPLVNVEWLKRHLADVLLLDASVTPQHVAGHIPGAVSADLYRYGTAEPARSVMQQRLQSWGLSPGRQIVVYDQGGDMMATRLFFDLYYNGVPASDLAILDGGLEKWRAAGGAVTQAPTPAPTAGNFQIGTTREHVRVRLPEFLVASGDSAGHALIDALEPDNYFGAQQFFDRAGHVPNALLMPSSSFFNADKTFKSPDEIRRWARYLGIQPGQVVLSHCGGGVAASVPWFALQFLASQAKVKLYLESQREWLRDERGLPFWTYAAPQLRRDSGWLNGWNGPMLRRFDVSQLNIVDVRAPAASALGHVPYALSLPAADIRSTLGQPQQLAERLGPAGVNPAHEVVLMANGGLTPDAALAFLAFEQLGHRKVSLLLDSVDDWGLRGYDLSKTPTLVGTPTAPGDRAVAATSYTASPRADLWVNETGAGHGDYPRVYVASGRGPSSRQPVGTVLQLPYPLLLTADGLPKPAAELWQLIEKAGVPRQAEVVLFADDPAEAAVNYYLFRLMGWPDLKVWLSR